MHFVDRQAKYPNRWTLIKSDGSSEIVTLVRNDEPVVVGTPMNAETLNTLSDVAGADVAREKAEAARDAAKQSETNSLLSEKAASTSASSAFASATNAAASASEAKQSAGEAAASAELAGTRAGTDKTLTIHDAPADARVTGEKLATLDLDLKLRYTKEQVNTLLTKYKADCMLATHPVGSLYISDDPTSPAELFGGTWEQIAADRALMGASSTHPAGTTAEAGLPNVFGQINALLCLGKASSDSNSALYPTWAANAGSQPLASGTAYPFAAQFNLGINLGRSSSIYGESSTVQPPAYYSYIWKRLE